jgi:hypothetical protein
VILNQSTKILIFIGVVHSDELMYIFYRPDKSPKFSKNDEENLAVERWLRIFENFARNGYSM